MKDEYRRQQTGYRMIGIVPLVFLGLLPSEWAKLPIEYDENPLETRDS